MLSKIAKLRFSFSLKAGMLFKTNMPPTAFSTLRFKATFMAIPTTHVGRHLGFTLFVEKKLRKVSAFLGFVEKNTLVN